MPEPMTKSVAQEQQEQKIEIRTAAKSIAGVTIGATAVALLAVPSPRLFSRWPDNDKYSLKSPSGIAFSDFRGYEDCQWSLPPAPTEAQVIVAIPMIEAYKTGVPGNGRPFPDGSMIVKLQWKRRRTPRPIRRRCARRLKQASSWKRTASVSKSGGWGYAVFNYDAASDKFTADPKSLQTAKRLPRP